ncbi:MAG: hypothetical protein ACXABV_04565 [Candidatus Thorarchaeota archaeon]
MSEKKKRHRMRKLTKKEMKELGRETVRHELKFDRRKRSRSAIEDVRKWAKSKKAPEDLPKPKRFRLKGRRFKSKDLSKLHAVHKSKTPLLSAMNQELTPEEFLDLSYSAFTVHQYQLMKDKYRSRLEAAKTKQEEAKIRREWRALVRGASKGFQRAGMRGVKEEDLDNLALEISRDKSIAKSIKKMAGSGVRERRSESNPDYAAGEIPVVSEVAEPIESIVEAYLELCRNPIEDIYEWVYKFEFSWKISLKIWCPTWFDPFRFCWTTFTIAGISTTISLEVGYRISCTGASAWGLASARTCATLLGIAYCFECTAEVVGVLGFTEVSDTGGCVYGAGVNCEFRCYWLGLPVAFLTAGIGLVIKAPCPDAPIEELVEYAKDSVYSKDEEIEEVAKDKIKDAIKEEFIEPIMEEILDPDSEES